METRSMADRFAKYDRENPQVYAVLRKLALQARRAGRSRLGMKMLWEVARWQLSLSAADDSPFRLNNNYTAFYARKLMREEPELAGMFELRAQRAACKQPHTEQTEKAPDGACFGDLSTPLCKHPVQTEGA